MCATHSTLLKKQQQHNNNNYIHQQDSYQQPNFSFYKSKKISPSRRLKNLLKPLMARIFKAKSQQPKRNSYIASDEKEAEFDWLHNEMDNRANEQLEERLYDQLSHCEQGAAIIIYDEMGGCQLKEIDKQDLYVPVHFARTNAGTFFWTSMPREKIEPLHIEWNFMDRWAQA